MINIIYSATGPGLQFNMSKMIVEFLNVGLPRKEHFPGKEIVTGICKAPVTGPLHLGKTGFAGKDGVGDGKHHGGPDKAVCVYSMDHYPYWENVLGAKLAPAAFGENLTISNLYEDVICIGDVFRLGTTLVQVSQPRQPCGTLAARYGRSDLVKLVIASGRTGFYFSVKEEGIVTRGDDLVLEQRDPRCVSISFANHIFHHDKTNREGIDRVLSIPALSESWRQSFLEMRTRCDSVP